MQSFTKPNLGKVCNGGPLTMEFHSTVFRGDDGIHKVALLVKKFIDAGGHQLQLNSVNHETLLDAQAHPENYQNLIVRVWGWSAYFVELRQGVPRPRHRPPGICRIRGVERWQKGSFLI